MTSVERSNSGEVSPVRQRLRAFQLRTAACVALAAVFWPLAAQASNVGVTSAVLPAARGTAPATATRVLKVGEDIFANERIQTDDGGKAHLLFLDGSALTVGPRSDIVLDEFVYDAKAGKGRIALSASRGILRLVGGKISKTTPIQIRTPTATIGIRGGIAIVEIRDQITARFLFGDALTITADNVTRTITRPGFEVTVAGNAPPNNPVPSQSQALADNIGDLEGNPSQTGQTRRLITESDVAGSQLGALGSQNSPQQVRTDVAAGTSTPVESEDTDLTNVVEDTAGPVNYAPLIGGSNLGEAIGDKATIAPFANLTLGDPNSEDRLTVTVEVGNQIVGGFTADSIAAAGFTVDANGNLVFSGTSPQVEAALRALVFTPNENQVAPGQSLQTVLTVNANDGITNTVQSVTNLTVQSINDLPVVSGTQTGQAVTDTATLVPFAAVTISDVDVGQSVTVTVTQSGAGAGSITAASLAASGFAGQSGVYTFTGSPAAAQAAIRMLVFAPAENVAAPGSVNTTVFSVDASDGLDMAADSSTTVLVTSVNDAPVLSNVGNSAAEVVASVQPFTTVTVSDVDASEVVTLTVSIVDPAQGDFTAASRSAAGFGGAGGTYTFTGSPADAQTAIRQLVFVSADRRVTTGNSENVQFNVVVDDGDATTPESGFVAVSCPTICRYDLAGQAKLGQSTSIGTDDNVAGANRGLATTSFISGRRFKATTAQGDYVLFAPTSSGSFTLTSTNTSPEGPVTGTALLAQTGDFLLYELNGSRTLLFAGKPLTNYSFNDSTFTGVDYNPRDDFTLGGSRVPFIPLPFQTNIANTPAARLTMLVGSGGAGAERYFYAGNVVVDGVGTNQGVAGSVLTGASTLAASGDRFFLRGAMRGVADAGGAGFETPRFAGPVATADDNAGNDIFGSSDPRYFVLESRNVDGTDSDLGDGGIVRSLGSVAFPDRIFPNLPVLSDATNFATFTVAAGADPTQRTSQTIFGYIAGAAVERDASNARVQVATFGSVPDAPTLSSFSISTDTATNRIAASMNIASDLDGFSGGFDTSTVIAFGGLSESRRSAFRSNGTFVAIDAAAAALVNSNTGSHSGFLVTNDQVTFAGGVIPASVTLCDCQNMQWGFVSTQITDPGSATYDIGLAQWVAGTPATLAQVNAFNGGMVGYEGHVVATIVTGNANTPGAVSRYTAFGSMNMGLSFNSGVVQFTGGTITLDGTTYTLSTGSPLTAPEFQFTLTDGAQRTGSGVGAVFSGVFNAGGRFKLRSNPNPPDYQGSGVFLVKGVVAVL